MSLRSRKRKMPQVGLDSARLHDAQDLVAKGARQAVRQVGPTTRQAREIAAQQMESARRWGAPRIDQAGQYVEEELGPRVGAMLHRTAAKVEPPSPRRRRRGVAALLLLIGAAVGAAGAILTRRKAASSAESTPEHLAAVSEQAPEKPDGEHAHTNS